MALSSCGKNSACFKGTGDIVKEQRVISDAITSIITEDNIDIVITQSNEAILTVEAGANLLPYIKTDISGSVLSISSDNRCGMFRDNTIPITVYLSIPNLTSIDYTGQGVITSTNTLVFPFFEFSSRNGTGSVKLDMSAEDISLLQHSGPADFTLSGNVKTIYIYTLGAGLFHLDDLVSKTTHINHSGIGDVFVSAEDKLLIELRSRGNVYYTGDPAITVNPYIGTGVIERK